MFPLGPHRRRWLVVAAATIGVFGLTFAVGLRPLVRAKVAREAARRKLDVQVGSVRPGLFTVTLRDVRIAPEGVGGVEARLDELRVDLTMGLAVREIVVRGGEIRVEGEPEDVADRLRAFRKGGGGGASAEGARHTPLAVEGLALVWRTPSGGEITAGGLQIVRDDASMRVTCTRIGARRDADTVEVVGVDMELGTDGSPRKIAAKSLSLAHEPPKGALAAARSSSSAGVDPAPPPLPVAVPRGKAARATLAKAAPRPAAPENDEPVFPMPDLHAARARIAVLAAMLGRRIPDGMKGEIGGLTVKVDVGGEPVTFGPGPFTIERHGEAVRLGFTSDRATSGGTPLSIDAELPLGRGDVTARLSGGPVSLALLGVKEGTKGLFDVGRGTVSGKGQLVLASGGDSLTFDGQIALRSISVTHPRLALEPLRGVDFAVSGRGLLDDAGRLRVDDAELDMGALHVAAHGAIEETKDHLGLSLSADVVPAACQALLDSAPQGLLPTVRQARMSGSFGATAHLVFDTRTIDKLVLDYTIDDRCKMVEVPPDLARDRFAGSFTYRTYHPDGTQGETTTGPGSDAWTPLDDISPYMIVAVLTTEDGAFFKHKGFNHAAIKNSVAANLKAKRFIRGASTITMQLAKNLFLSRDKALSRKIEEVVLTDYLEQGFTKDDMMELYLNVIEFGPDVYGIARAADYYFGRKPEELTLPECFFLSSLLPSPVRYGKLRDKGEMPDYWTKHLQALIEIAAKNSKITKAELDEALGQKVVFWKPGEPRPEPRHPLTKRRREPYEDDKTWQPLD